MADILQTLNGERVLKESSMSNDLEKTKQEL